MMLLDQYFVALLLKEEQKPRMDFLPNSGDLKKEAPHTMLGLSSSGISSMVQGTPPILAQIWIITLLTIDLTFFPALIVPTRTT